MSYYGRNDQAVTANSTTTAETSNGAPIGTFSYVKGSGRGTSPVAMTANAKFGNTSAGSAASVDYNMFNNTTPGAFLTNMAVGVFGVSATEMSNNVTNKVADRPAHAGWVLRRAGTGPVVNASYTGTATGYNNTDVITVASPQAGGNATITLVTNSTGGNLQLTIATPGAGFLTQNVSSLTTIANSTGGASAGSGATFVVNAGGRAGRVHTETLIAMGSLGAQTAAYGTPALVADASDNTYYPGT